MGPPFYIPHRQGNANPRSRTPFMNISDQYKVSLQMALADRRRKLKEAIRIARVADHRLAETIFTEELNDLKIIEKEINENQG